MLYAKPELSGNGKVRFGISHVHVLNRHGATNKDGLDVTLLKYIFPRQFGLHNVFTSDIDPKDTAQQFKDYTTRDLEIARYDHHWRQRRLARLENGQTLTPPLPKRLRGRVLQLVARLRKRHSKCAYAALLEHYCPNPLAKNATAMGSIEHASSAAQVSAFCRAVILKVFPAEFWGAGVMRSLNQKLILRNVDKFVRLRRYESLTLHVVLEGVKVHAIAWLAPQKVDGAAKLSNTDIGKRKELVAELLYYVFDAFLIPLIRGHFHVTESGVQRNQLFYFRHDVWKTISRPALTSMQRSMFEPCNTAEVKRGLAKRALGVSQVRLLPKEYGMRPIINLRRRVQKLQKGQLVLGKSINSILTPTFSVFNYERTVHPSMVASALFSVEDMYPRLQAFRTSLEDQGLAGSPLYFAKVDVKSCFDTIPQKRLMELARSILGADMYHVTKYSRAKLLGGHKHETPGFGAKPSWRYLTKATAGSKDFDFNKEVESDSMSGRSKTIYVDGVLQKSETRKAILDLLEEHVESNLIQMGNRFYRQKEGIPQGSIVSSLLCSYFYGGV